MDIVRPDLRQLSSQERKEAYFEEVLGKAEEGLADLIGFYEESKQAMVEAGFTEEDAAIEAGRSAFRGLAGAIRNKKDQTSVRLVNNLDAMIRDFHDIRHDHIAYDHADPLVAGFYTELLPWIRKPSPMMRSDGW